MSAHQGKFFEVCVCFSVCVWLVGVELTEGVCEKSLINLRIYSILEMQGN